MMMLEEQIISLLFSLFYGMLMALLTTINYKVFFSSNLFIQILGTFLLIVIILLGFYCGLIFINNGVIHPYFILMLVSGYCIGNVNYKKILVYFKKKQ